jgi:hypothetical protein
LEDLHPCVPWHIHGIFLGMKRLSLSQID